MEPKDLKNSKELKSTKKSDPENSEKEKVSEKKKKAEKKIQPENSDVEDVKENVIEEKTAEEVEISVEREIVKNDKSVLADSVEETITEVVEETTEVSDFKTETKVEVEEEKTVEAVEIPEETEIVDNIKSTVTNTVEETIPDVVEETTEAFVDADETEIKVETEKAPKSEVEVGVIKGELTTETDVPKEETEIIEKGSIEEKVLETEEVTTKEETPKTEEVVASEEKTIKPKRKAKKEVVDYSNHSQVELVNAMRDILDNNDNQDNIKDVIETIKSVFYKNLNENVEAAKKVYIEEGGVEADFVASEDPYENDIKDLLKRYRQIRIEFSRKIDSEKEDNLKLKYQVIEDIKGLINNEESINKTFHDFKELQIKWREIGLVPQSKMKNLWDTYHFHVENFYDYIKINRELRDLDLKRNFEAKIKLCEQAEELLVEPSIIKAFNILQKYHEQWREIGPVPRDHKDDIWERFKSATSKINKKHQDFFENRKSDQKKNLDAKIALCEKVEEINNLENIIHKDWDEKSRELVELQKIWRTIGFAPKKDNNKIYERFRTACDKFFDAKREFYSKNKELQQNNLQLKVDLCIQAEGLKDNSDWKKSTQDFINIQKKWKEIGPVPRKHSDMIWKRFRAACDYFFEKKSEHFSGIDTEHVDNLAAKEALIEEVVSFKSIGDVDENLKQLKSFQRKWTEIGHVPFKKKDEIQIKFRDAINKLFDELNIDDDKRNLLKFRSKMTSFSESTRGQNKMRMEREKYMNKLKQLESDLVLLDNNIGFFAKSKNADSLIEDVKKKIEMSKQKIEFLKNKIRVIDEMDRSENY